MNLSLPNTLEEMEALIRAAPSAHHARFVEIGAEKLALVWVSQPGPQTEAFESEADELLYGGAVGGGKTDLIAGLCTTAHQQSLVFRQQLKDLDDFWNRLIDILPTPKRRNDVKKAMTTHDDRRIECGQLGAPGSERDWQGRPHDLLAFDEAAQMDELRVEFVLRWLRSVTPGQRKRAVFATNPPMPEIRNGQLVDVGLGDWLMRWFAPWIDDRFPNPAKPGELRWCFMRSEGDRLITVWVDGPGAYDMETGERRLDATREDIEAGRVSVARSRTFIRSLLKDNIYLRGTGYAEKLSGTPEPLRTMLLTGDFTVRGEDHPFQILPTQWVLDAQERWLERDEDELLRLKQLVLYGDVAQGGADTTVLAPLMQTDYYDELITRPGRLTPTGKEVMKLILEERLDASMIVLDATGGWAGSTRDLLKVLHDIDVEMHTVSMVDGSHTPDNVYKYINLRAKMWWEFRLALNPKSGFRICLPPGSRVRVQLTTPHFHYRGNLLIVEEKDEIRKRIGSSTDEADAVVGAWQYRDDALAKLMSPEQSFIDRINGRRSTAIQGEAMPMIDPREDW